jgi:hypothetical protein
MEDPVKQPFTAIPNAVNVFLAGVCTFLTADTIEAKRDTATEPSDPKER